jgi:hypothetical protein
MAENSIEWTDATWNPVGRDIRGERKQARREGNSRDVLEWSKGEPRISEVYVLGSRAKGRARIDSDLSSGVHAALPSMALQGFKPFGWHQLTAKHHRNQGVRGKRIRGA